MKKLSMLLAAVAFCVLAPNVAHAQATRTWVSGVGDDANPCSRTAPCKTFAGAISKTAASGEIDCLDPGGFGALTITKAISIICGQSGIGGVLVAGTAGMVVNAGANDEIYLDGLSFDGLGPAGNGSTDGVQIINAAHVTIVRSVIHGFINGVNIINSTNGVRVDVIDSTITNNSGEGIQSKPSGSVGNRVVVEHTTVSNNGGDGIMANGTGTSGQIKMTVRNSESVHNTDDGVVSYSAGTVVVVTVDSTNSFDNNRGFNASGSNALLEFTRSTVSANAIGVNEVSPGMALSYGTNAIDGNGTPGSFGTTSQQ